MSTTIFTDGAARNNPGPGGWGTIIVTADGQVTELGGAAAHTTNNQMEMTAALQGLLHIRSLPGAVTIHTDSKYLVQGITQWIRGWQRRGWLTAEGQPVLNRELWQKLDELVRERGRAGAITWNHVRGHAGVPGNERCDEIATALADGESISLFRGSLDQYDVDITDLRGSLDTNKLADRKRSSGGRSSSSGAAAYSYLSLVGGRLERHRTWAECERRVKGVSGAKFKKAMSLADEAAIARSWGCEPLVPA